MTAVADELGLGPRRAKLIAALSESGVLAPEWRPVFEAVPRDAFAPQVIWFGRGDEEWRLLPCDRSSEPDLWAEQVLGLSGVTTQVDDGVSPGMAGGRAATSVEVDEEVAATARQNLSRVGLSPLVVTADGQLGYPPGAP